MMNIGFSAFFTSNRILTNYFILYLFCQRLLTKSKTGLIFVAFTIILHRQCNNNKVAELNCNIHSQTNPFGLVPFSSLGTIT